MPLLSCSHAPLIALLDSLNAGWTVMALATQKRVASECWPHCASHTIVSLRPGAAKPQSKLGIPVGGLVAATWQVPGTNGSGTREGVKQEGGHSELWSLRSLGAGSTSPIAWVPKWHAFLSSSRLSKLRTTLSYLLLWLQG